MATTPPKKSRISTADCSLAKSIEEIGDRWTLLLLRSAFFGLRRYGDFQKELSIPRTVLSGRLKKLVALGIMEMVNYRETGQRPRPEYFLTQKGADLAIPLIALNQWGDRWLRAEQDPPPLVFQHKLTGENLTASLTQKEEHKVPLSSVKRKIGS